VLAPGAEEPLTVTGSGQDVWDLLDRPQSTEELVSALSSRFTADPATIRDDVVALVERLAAAGALEELPGPRR
jgi:Coenzyme PQQ synthesis protein D (PqqD)